MPTSPFASVSGGQQRSCHWSLGVIGGPSVWGSASGGDQPEQRLREHCAVRRGCGRQPPGAMGRKPSRYRFGSVHEETSGGDGRTAVLEVGWIVAVPRVPSAPELWGLWDIILVAFSAQMVYKRKCSSPCVSSIWFAGPFSSGFCGKLLGLIVPPALPRSAGTGGSVASSQLQHTCAHVCLGTLAEGMASLAW